MMDELYCSVINMITKMKEQTAKEADREHSVRDYAKLFGMGMFATGMGLGASVATAFPMHDTGQILAGVLSGAGLGIAAVGKTLLKNTLRKE